MDNRPASDVTSDSFNTDVLERSWKIPVLVDFWADWCNPCKMLMPILAGLVDELQGKFHLAKVDTDREQQIASQYGVRSLPTVKLFKDGTVVDEFVGVLPERSIREFLERHLDRPADDDLKQAEELARQKKFAEAVTLLKKALADDPNYDKLRLGLAQHQVADGDHADAKTTLKGVSLLKQQDPDYKALLARIDMSELAGQDLDTQTLKENLASVPDDHDARRQLSMILFFQGDIEGAMEQALEIVKTGREEAKDTGREALLRMFEALGQTDEHVTRYRRLLAQALN